MFYNKKIEEVLEEVNSSPLGLSKKEVENRLEKYGKNVLPSKKKKSILKILLN